MRKALKIILKAILVFLGVILTCQVILLLIAPIYSFQEPKPFSGPKWHNPYTGLDSTNWRKGNFHFHTREWYGLTAGSGNTTEQFWETYKKLNYDIPTISNYQSINEFNKDSAFYLPVYEHGFGIRKKHQILIGAERVLWFDYSLYQNVHHKQHIINMLRPDNAIVAIAHPDWENGYTLNDMAWLSNYDLLEVLDHNWRSIPQWDAALSAGRPVYILADDDAHDITDPYEIMRCATFIHARELTSAELIASLKAGRSYGADIYMSEGETFDDKAIRAKEIPKLHYAEITGDTLWVEVSKRAMKFTFIGQGGKAKKVVYNTGKAFYVLQPEDTYIRTEIVFFNRWKGPGTDFYLNPVFRYDGEVPTNILTAEVNFERTWIFRLLSFGSLALLGVVFWKLRQLRKAKKQSA